MPIYAYKCGSCGLARDILQKMSDAPLVVCPACGEPAFSKQLTAAGFQLKGSGWYATDFRGGQQKPDKKEDGGKDGDKSDSKSDGKTDGKSDGKSDGKTETKAGGKSDSKSDGKGDKKTSAPATDTPAKASKPEAAGGGGASRGRH